ncbi:hypothetical protein GGR56DRAFT_173149 [Xylariaceae sp. FL0804]|nr:hypothetical protein GGR56DRAFT_173149 [Xylariaceae sp. FL0804]
MQCIARFPYLNIACSDIARRSGRLTRRFTKPQSPSAPFHTYSDNTPFDLFHVVDVDQGLCNQRRKRPKHLRFQLLEWKPVALLMSPRTASSASPSSGHQDAKGIEWEHKIRTSLKSHAQRTAAAASTLDPSVVEGCRRGCSLHGRYANAALLVSSPLRRNLVRYQYLSAAIQGRSVRTGCSPLCSKLRNTEYFQTTLIFINWRLILVSTRHLSTIGYMCRRPRRPPPVIPVPSPEG